MWVIVFLKVNASTFILQPKRMSSAVLVPVAIQVLLAVDGPDATMGSTMVCQRLPILSF